MWPWLLIQLSSGAALVIPEITYASGTLVEVASMAIGLKAESVSAVDADLIRSSQAVNTKVD